VPHDLELVRDLRVPPLELCSVGDGIGWHGHGRILAVGRDRPTAVRRLAA
jgi:hypothetical protein